MERIVEISRELTATMPLNQLLQKIVAAAVELTGSEIAGVLLEREGRLRFIAAHQFADQLLDIPVPIDASIAGAAFSSGQAVIVPDVRDDSRYYPEVGRLIGYKARSLLAVPIQFQDRCLGVLEVENKYNDLFEEADVEVLGALAAQAGAAIENARLIESLQSARDLATALRQAGAALGSTLDLDEVLERILEQMGHVVSYDAANIMLIEGDEARVHRGLGYEQFGTADLLTSIHFKIADVPNLHRMVHSGEPVIIPDVAKDEDWVPGRPEHAWIASYIGVPISIRDRVAGFLNVSSATPGFFGPADVARLQIFANHAAVALENAQLYRQTRQQLDEQVRFQEELQRYRDHLEELVQERTADLFQAVTDAQDLSERLQIQHEIAQSILAARSPETIAIAAVHRIRRLIPCQSVVLLGIQEDDRVEMLAAEVSNRTGPLADIGLYRELSRGKILRQGGVQGVADLTALAHLSPAQSELHAAGVRSYIIVPLSIQGELIGTLNLASDQARFFSAEHVDIAADVATSLAIAIRQARLYQQSRQEIAEREQVEQDLRRSQAQLGAILDSTHQAFVLLDREYRIQAFNAPAQEISDLLLGSELRVGGMLRRRKMPAELHDFVRNFRRALAGERVIVERKLAGRHEDDEVWVALSFNPVFGDGERTAGVCINATNITDRKQAERAQRQAAAAAERDRLARDLHDSVTQALFSATLVAEVLPQVWEREPEKALQGVVELGQLTRGALSEMRTLLLELRPAALVQADLDSLLQQLTTAITGRVNIQPSVNTRPTPSLSPTVHLAFYRVAQEALHNVVKHARAAHVGVTLDAAPPFSPGEAGGWQGQVRLEVCDDGRGFDPDRAGAGQLGLGIMRERADSIGAALSIDSRPGQGTVVGLVWEGET
jgi:PAS domain S-box-containing protein